MNPTTSLSLAAQMRGWATLKGLRPVSIDLGRVQAIRDRAPDELLEMGTLESLMPELGLNDEGTTELPVHLLPHCGSGLRVWQYPIQFGPYLRQLARLNVRSYLELGVRHGGSFVLTVEFLNRFRPLDFAVGVDIIPCPSMAEYQALNPRSEFVCVNTQLPAFGALIERIGSIDLAFIDSHHEEAQCRREFAQLQRVSNMVAFHDVSNVNCPGVRVVWEEVKAMDAYQCFEFTDQYGAMGPYMGIGLAVKRVRMEELNQGGPEGPEMRDRIDRIKTILATIKALPSSPGDLPDNADIVNDVKLDSIEMLQFMLEVEAKLAIRIDFEKLEFSSLSSIRTLAEFLSTMPAAPPQEAP